MTELSRRHLEAFLSVVEYRSIQAAARAAGRSRATYQRYLEDVRGFFQAPVLLDRAPGQRLGVVTPAGEELARRARMVLRYWDRWEVATRDALARGRGALRVGTLAGSFDLLADLLATVRRQTPALSLHVVELPDADLLSALIEGAVDLSFGTRRLEEPPTVSFLPLGELPWAVIIPPQMADAFPAELRLPDLDAVPMVVPRAGPARTELQRQFAGHPAGPLMLNAAFEVGSTPRLVEMVARGFGPAVVSEFRTAFVPQGVLVRPLLDGPPPLTAGVYIRRGYAAEGHAAALIDEARARFRELAPSVAAMQPV